MNERSIAALVAWLDLAIVRFLPWIVAAFLLLILAYFGLSLWLAIEDRKYPQEELRRTAGLQNPAIPAERRKS